LDKPSGAVFSNPSTSELARDSENTSLYRSASIPASALRADEDRRSEDGPMEYTEHSTGERGLKTDLEDLNTDSLDNLPSAIRYQTSGSAKPILVVAPGLARYEKGSDILQEAVKLVLKDEPNDVPIRFVLQWSENFVLPNGSRCRPDAELKNDWRVEFSKDLLIGDEYLDFLRRADLIVLPYRSESYRARVSRVAIEAAMLGKPMIYNKGSWIKEVADLAGCGVEASEENAEALACALEMAMVDLEKLRSLAESGAERVRDFYNVASFRKLLCNIVEKKN
jgi:glycosyltransferase involved in cell wall biosynthesis